MKQEDRQGRRPSTTTHSENSEDGYIREAALVLRDGAVLLARDVRREYGGVTIGSALRKCPQGRTVPSRTLWISSREVKTIRPLDRTEVTV